METLVFNFNLITMKTHTDITIILDCSASMELIKSSTIEGFNSFLRAHKSDKINARVTLIQFNQDYKTVFEEKKIKKKRFLNDNNFLPSGSTALHDAIGKTIDGVNKRIAKYPVCPKVIVAIITDGEENSSELYSRNMIKKEIGRRIEKDNWNFMFLGANQDAIFEGNRLGIPSDYSHTFEASSEGVNEAFETSIKFSKRMLAIDSLEMIN